MEKREKVVSSIANIYKLDGRVPLSKAIPFGLQHILAMFVANLTPIMMIGYARVAGNCPRRRSACLTAPQSCPLPPRPSSSGCASCPGRS